MKNNHLSSAELFKDFSFSPLLLNRLGAADSGSFLRGCETESDSGTEGEALQLRIVFRTSVQCGTDICERKE